MRLGPRSKSIEAASARGIDTLRAKVGSPNLHTWFRPALFLGVHESRAILQLPNKFFIDWITDHYHGALLESLREVVGAELTGVALRANPNAQGELFPRAERRSETSVEETPRRAAR